MLIIHLCKLRWASFWQDDPWLLNVLFWELSHSPGIDLLPCLFRRFITLHVNLRFIARRQSPKAKACHFSFNIPSWNWLLATVLFWKINNYNRRGVYRGGLALFNICHKNIMFCIKYRMSLTGKYEICFVVWNCLGRGLIGS